MSPKQYVQVTFRPVGSERMRTTWAIKVREHKGVASYVVCDKFGETEKDVGETIRKEVLLCDMTEVVERPARMNLKYAELELA